MRKLISLLLILTAVSLMIGCTGSKTIEASLNKQFELAIEQTASIASEDLEIKFMDVTADSRCPKDVQCPWAGEVKCLLKITANGSTQEVELTQPGSSDTGETVGNYTYRFNVEPYPESTKEIKKDDYRLVMTVSKP